jgi:O-methyltransferase involved in polyketide biosynthesis
MTDIHLGGLAKTLLVPLYGRYLETQRADAIIRDARAVEIIEQGDVDVGVLGELGEDSQVITAVRTRILDEQVVAFLERYPTAVVVNLGCGLCSRYERIDNGRIYWYEMDVAQVYALWQRFFRERERHRFLICSVFDFAWMRQIVHAHDTPVLLVAEGLLQYYHPAMVRQLFLSLQHVFPTAHILFDAINLLFVGLANLRLLQTYHVSARFKWGTTSLHALEQWGTGIRLMAEFSVLERYPHRRDWMSYIRQLPGGKYLYRIGHVRLERA